MTTLAALAGLAFAPPATADRPPAPGPVRAGAADPDPSGGLLGRDPWWGAESSPLMRPERAVRYWTPGKQAKASPVDLPRSAPSPHGGARSARPYSVPTAKRLTPGGDDNGYARVPRPYTGAANSRISGRLFFVNAFGQGDSCSASVVRSATGLLIVTAAHCVYGVPPGSVVGRWHSNFAFVPAYDGRAESVRRREPYGR
ncbi:hypothetical protein C1J01_33850, partial [Nonomuraea aridisoli]